MPPQSRRGTTSRREPDAYLTPPPQGLRAARRTSHSASRPSHRRAPQRRATSPRTKTPNPRVRRTGGGFVVLPPPSRRQLPSDSPARAMLRDIDLGADPDVACRAAARPKRGRVSRRPVLEKGAPRRGLARSHGPSVEGSLFVHTFHPALQHERKSRSPRPRQGSVASELTSSSERGRTHADQGAGTLCMCMCMCMRVCMCMCMCMRVCMCIVHVHVHVRENVCVCCVPTPLSERDPRVCCHFEQLGPGQKRTGVSKQRDTNLRKNKKMYTEDGTSLALHHQPNHPPRPQWDSTVASPLKSLPNRRQVVVHPVVHMPARLCTACRWSPSPRHSPSPPWHTQQVASASTRHRPTWQAGATTGPTRFCCCCTLHLPQPRLRHPSQNRTRASRRCWSPTPQCAVTRVREHARRGTRCMARQQPQAPARHLCPVLLTMSTPRLLP